MPTPNCVCRRSLRRDRGNWRSSPTCRPTAADRSRAAGRARSWPGSADCCPALGSAPLRRARPSGSSTSSGMHRPDHFNQTSISLSVTLPAPGCRWAPAPASRATNLPLSTLGSFSATVPLGLLAVSPRCGILHLRLAGVDLVAGVSASSLLGGAGWQPAQLGTARPKGPARELHPNHHRCLLMPISASA